MVQRVRRRQPQREVPHQGAVAEVQGGGSARQGLPGGEVERGRPRAGLDHAEGGHHDGEAQRRWLLESRVWKTIST